MKKLTQAAASSLPYRGEIIHRTENNADGTPVRARVNGAIKLWKTRPNDWRLPMKHGLYECFYIGVSNSVHIDQSPDDWGIPEAGEQFEKRG